MEGQISRRGSGPLAEGDAVVVERKVLILGLGNTLLSDDGIGIYAARELKERLRGTKGVEVDETEAWGLSLLEKMVGYEQVVIVDAVKTGGARPGTVYRLSLEDLGGSYCHPSSHKANLPYLVELGKAAGLDVPRRVTLLAVEVEVVDRFGEGLSPGLRGKWADIVAELLAQVTSLLATSPPGPGGQPGGDTCP